MDLHGPTRLSLSDYDDIVKAVSAHSQARYKRAPLRQVRRQVRRLAGNNERGEPILSEVVLHACALNPMEFGPKQLAKNAVGISSGPVYYCAPTEPILHDHGDCRRAAALRVLPNVRNRDNEREEYT